MLNIVKGTDAIKVSRTTVCLFGQPGIGKSSLGYTAEKPLLLDFDSGAHRAMNRRDTLVIDSWATVEELLSSAGVLDEYATVVTDTVGRCLDLMTVEIIRDNPKMGRDGALSQQGWGVLKGRFRTFQSRLHALGKDLVLIAHDREEKDGETRIVRPDIAGGSFGEVMKAADFVGYFYMHGKTRVLDFSPTDRWYGKNPAQWQPFTVPANDTDFLGKLIKQGREHLGNVSAEHAAAFAVVEEWRHRLDAVAGVDDLNATLGEIKKLEPPIVRAQVTKLLGDRGKALGLKSDKAKGVFVAAAAEAVA